MDISKQYIKMCQDAQEIQVLKKELGFEDLDYFYIGKENFKKEPMILVQGYSYHIFSKDDVNFEKFVWLPRQDQLQDLVIGDDHRYDDLFLYFKDFVLVSPLYSGESYLSLEKLWLLFIMDFLYQKQWDFESETWIECEI